jgi:hypothetical protein
MGDDTGAKAVPGLAPFASVERRAVGRVGPPLSMELGSETGVNFVDGHVVVFDHKPVDTEFFCFCTPPSTATRRLVIFVIIFFFVFFFIILVTISIARNASSATRNIGGFNVIIKQLIRRLGFHLLQFDMTTVIVARFCVVQLHDGAAFFCSFVYGFDVLWRVDVAVVGLNVHRLVAFVVF